MPSSQSTVSAPARVVHEIETELRTYRRQTDRLALHLLQHGPALYPHAEDTLLCAAALADLRRTVTRWRNEQRGGGDDR